MDPKIVAFEQIDPFMGPEVGLKTPRNIIRGPKMDNFGPKYEIKLHLDGYH